MKELFHFSLFERKGIVSLLCMATILFLLPRWWSRHGYSGHSVQVEIITTSPPAPASKAYAGKPDTPPEEATTSVAQPVQYASSRAPQSVPVIYINQATATEWAGLRGIGPVLSRRIVLFRDKMGGFATTGQVGETYGLPDSVFQAIQPFLRLKKPHRTWPVNQLSAEELARHPYISNHQARAIETYRNKSGLFSNARAFRELRVFSEEEHDRLAPYLDFSLPSTHGTDRTRIPAVESDR